MAVVQLQARVFTDGAVKDHGGAGVPLFQEFGRNPVLAPQRNYIAYFELEGDTTESPTIQLERQLNSGSWANVTTSSTVAKANISSGQEDGEATVNTLTGSARTFSPGTLSTDGLTAAQSLSTVTHTEIGFSFYIPAADVSDGDIVRLRCYDATSGDFTYTETIEITVEDQVLPAIIADAPANTHIETASFYGPIVDSNGAMYVFSEGNANWAANSSENGYSTYVWKSTDGGKHWMLIARTDTATQGMEDLEAFAVTRVAPNTVGEYWVVIGNGSGGDAEYDIWRTSDHATNPDTFAVTNAQRFGAGTGPTEHYIAMTEKSDGDLVFVTGELIGGNERVVFDYQAAGVWNGKATLSNVTGKEYAGARASLGASDRTLVVYHNMTDRTIEARCIEDAGTLLPAADEIQVSTLSAPLDGSPDDSDASIIDIVCYDRTNDHHLVVYLVNNADAPIVLAANTLKWNGSTYVAGDEIILSPTAADLDYPEGVDANGIVGGSVAVDEATGRVYITYVGTDFVHYLTWWEDGDGQVSEVDSDDFTGTNSDPWDTDRWTDDSTGSGIVDIQTNQGRLQYSTGYARAYSDAIYGQVVDVVFELDASDTSGDMHVGLMEGTTWDSGTVHLPNDGYGINIIAYGQPTTFENIGGIYGALSSFGVNPGTSTYWYRLLYDGTYVRAKGRPICGTRHLGSKVGSPRPQWNCPPRVCGRGHQRQYQPLHRQPRNPCREPAGPPRSIPGPNQRHSRWVFVWSSVRPRSRQRWRESVRLHPQVLRRNRR
jgi:hypothetical protein